MLLSVAPPDGAFGSGERGRGVQEPEDVIRRYRRLVREGVIRDDDAQRAAVEKLRIVQHRLAAMPRRRGILRVFPRRRPRPVAGDCGIYLYGSVGRGKSLLMDLFFATAPEPARRRIHFHAFMQEIHAALRRERAADTGQPLQRVAAAVAGEARLLCFDEFQVENIVDAMILGQLFEALFGDGVTVVLTANQPPADLYRDGLNRDLFLPFIDIIEARLDVHEISGGRDYRLGAADGGRYFAPLGPEADREMELAWRLATGGAETPARALPVLGREWRIPAAVGRIGRIGFEEICGAALGPADYLAVADAFDILFLDRIPILPPARRDAARRLTTLVDALYEAGSGLVCSADGEPGELCPEGDGAFAFRRTASRLHEMRQAGWGPARLGRLGDRG